jgi:DNA-binding GntR family transcriptional regulator
MRELYLIAGALQGIAARLAADLATDSRGELAREMKRLNNDLRAATALTPTPIGQAQDLHVRFHQSFVAAAAGPRLRAEWEGLQPQVERYERAYTSTLITNFEESLQEHEAMITAMEAGDAEAAERSTVLNWRNGIRRHRGAVEMLGERGIW